MTKTFFTIYDIQDFLGQGTGGKYEEESYRVVDYPVGEFVVKVALTPSNKFVGIIEVSLDKDFRTYQQKLSNIGFEDVEKYYRED